MSKKKREFMDKNHRVMGEYYDLCEKNTGRKTAALKKQMKQLIEKDPNFLDPYLFIYEILQDEGKLEEAEKILDEAYQRAIKRITDKQGNWPDVMAWGWLENRHIIRTIFNKAVSFWLEGETDKALELYRKLLKTNPNDNVGAREHILAVRMKMSFERFEKRFNRGGYYDNDLPEWFDKHYRQFPDEFGWWEKEMKRFE